MEREFLLAWNDTTGPGLAGDRARTIRMPAIPGGGEDGASSAVCPFFR
jgi:hypothetical protein